MRFYPYDPNEVRLTREEPEGLTRCEESNSQQPPPVSPLFTKLAKSVNRRRLLLDRCYFKLVSEIAELLNDEEVALLALYLAPPLAIGMQPKEHRMAISIMRMRRKEVGDA